jgi:hypothetical protein
MTTQTAALPRISPAPGAGANNFVPACLILTGLFALLASQLRDDLLWLPAAFGLAAAILASPRVGLYALVVAMAVDSAPYDPLTRYLSGVFRAAPAGLTLTPVEIVAIGALLSWSLHSMANASWRFPDKAVAIPVSLLYMLLVMAWLHGAASGGDAITGLWEVRALLLVGPVLFLTVGVLERPEHLKQFSLVVVGSLALMSLELGWRYLKYIRPGEFDGPLETAFSHDGSVLIAAVMVMATAWVIWGPNRKQRLIALALALAVGAVLLASRRRAALIAGEAGLVFLLLTLFFTDRWRFIIVAVVGVVAISGYFAVFWESSNAFGQPVRAFQTVFQPEALSDRDQSSDEYRRVENFDVWTNIHSHPIQGIGFGKAYDKPVPLPDLSVLWPFWDYTPHNTILWLWMKAGFVTFVVFWLVIATGCSRAIEAARTTRDNLPRALAGCAFACFAVVIMFAYVDLGLVSPRIMILLGLALGISTLLSNDKLNPSQEAPAVSRGPVWMAPSRRRKYVASSLR